MIDNGGRFGLRKSWLYAVGWVGWYANESLGSQTLGEVLEWDIEEEEAESGGKSDSTGEADKGR